MKKVKGLRGTNWWLQNSRGDIVSNTVITTYGVRWALELLGDHLVNYVVV